MRSCGSTVRSTASSRIARSALTLEDDRVRIAPRASLGADAYPRAVVVGDIVEAGADGASPLRQRLGIQTATADFDGADLTEFLDWVRGLADCDLSLPADVAEEHRKVTYKGKARLDEMLDALLLPLQLSWDAHRGAIWVKRALPPARAPGLAARHVALVARGITVPELVAALGSQSIETIASPEAWGSPGTFSLVVDEPLGSLVATIASRTSLRVWIAHPALEREVLVLDGAVASVGSALGVPVPPFAGAASDLADLRARLHFELEARTLARRNLAIPVDDLYAWERAVDLSANAILALARRVEAATTSRERWEAAREALKAQEARVAAARAEIVKIGAQIVEDEGAKEAEIEAHRKKKPVNDGTGRDVLSRESQEWATQRWTETLQKLTRESLGILRTGNTETARAQYVLGRAERRAAQLTREMDAAETDMGVLRRLEHGARLDAADRR
jgi:hypothetical protein